MKTTLNVIAQFNHSNATIASAIAKLMETKVMDPSKFRLSVVTPDDTMPEGAGQYRFEAPVVVELLRTAYSEIVSAVNRTTRRDQAIAQIDRHRSMSGWDDQYDGADDKEISDDELEDALGEAIDRAEVILRYAHHIAAIKSGGAEWLAGFEIDKWVPMPGLKDDPEGNWTLEGVMKACVSEVGLADHIRMGRVQKVKTVVDNRLLSFNEWCDKEIHRKGQDEGWKNKLAYARSCNIVLHDIPVNTACEYIGDIVLSSAFQRTTTRLQDAVRQVANNRYLGLAYAIQNEIAVSEPSKKNIERAQKKAFDFLGYSDLLARDIAAVRTSDEWQDHQLDLDVKAAEDDAKRDERQAFRELAMFNIEKRALAIAATRSKADEIRAMIAKERAELTAPKADAAQPDATQAEADAKAKRAAAAKKAAATRARKAAEAQATKKLSGIAGTKTMPSLNPTGLRH